MSELPLLSQLSQLHWLRPELVWIALPMLLALLWLARRQRPQRGWQQHIDAELLPYLLDDSEQRPRRLWPTALAALICWLALMGPSWEKVPSPILEDRSGLVIVLDLSPSMLAQDVQPSRLERAKYTIRDLLRLRADGQTALVASAGDAFVVAPLTDDGNTLSTLLPALHPGMMPLPGSNPLAGLTLAAELLARGGSANGHILLIGDGFSASQLTGLKDFARNSQYPLSILAVGSERGAPIPLPEGGFVKDSQGKTVLASVPTGLMKSLSRDSGGQYAQLDSQLSEQTLSTLASGSRNFEEGQRQQTMEQWRDGGVWLVLLLLPLALLSFRRNVLPLILLAVVGLPESSHALDWQSTLKTPDQRGAALFDSDPGSAATQFVDPMWRGSALYRAGNYAAAAQAFAQRDSADAHYNRGNALARAGKLDEAIDAYQQALDWNPDMADAKANKALLEQLKQQQEQQGDQQNSGGNDAQDSQDSQDSESTQNSDSQESADDQQGSPGDQQQDGKPQDGDKSPDDSDVSQPQNDSNADERDSTEPSDDAQSEAQQQAQRDAAAEHARQQEASETESSVAEKTSEPSDEQLDSNAAAGSSQEPLSEEEQAQEQWLRNIPDSADQLLRNKFQYQYMQRRQRGEQPEAENYAPY